MCLLRQDPKNGCPGRKDHKKYYRRQMRYRRTLVVTFTRAAAAQMKGKIIKELEKVCESGEKPELVKQLSMAEKADITTIDGFCNHVVKR